MDITGILITTAIILATIAIFRHLIRAALAYRKEAERRLQGCFRVVLDNHGSSTAGFFAGVFGYLGLLFILGIFFLSGLNGPNWLMFASTAGIMLGFFYFVRWAMRVNMSLATSYLSLDHEGISNTQNDVMMSRIEWSKPWKLKQMTQSQTDQVGEILQEVTDYTLILRLTQGSSKISLRFKSAGEEDGGWPEPSDKNEGHEVNEEEAWLKSEILSRVEAKAKAKAEDNNIQLQALPPDPALMKNLGFDKHALANFKRGLCTAAQVSTAKHNPGGIAAAFAVVALFFCGLAAGAIWGDLSPASSGLDIIVLVTFFLLLALICFVLASTSWGEYRNGFGVSEVQGKMALTYYAESNGFWLRVGATGIRVSSDTYQLFEAQHYYKLYFIDPLLSPRILIAAEELIGKSD
jgi:hypothetical protein